MQLHKTIREVQDGAMNWDRGQHMGGASGELGMFPFLTWILVQAFVCEKYILLQIDNSYSVHFYLLSRIVYS